MAMNFSTTLKPCSVIRNISRLKTSVGFLKLMEVLPIASLENVALAKGRYRITECKISINKAAKRTCNSLNF